MLQTVAIYFLKVIIISSLLLAYYGIALRNKRFHYYNRFYLLLTVLLSIVLPFLHLEWFSFNSNSQQAIKIYNLMYANGGEVIVTSTASRLNWQNIIMYAAMFISLVLLASLVMHVVKLYVIKKKFPVQKMAEFDFINTDVQQAPFSFLKNIFWRKDISLDDETGKQILRHELTHVQQKHSHDKLFMQVVMCFFWMNPFFWLIRKELYVIHEFIADEKAVENNDAAAFAEMLLTTQFGKFNYLPAQSLYYSSIKRRLIMLTQSNKARFTYLRRLMVLPLIIIITGLFAFTVKSYNENKPTADSKRTDENVSKINLVAGNKLQLTNHIITADEPFTLVVNAGHGGKDNGAYANGIYEKDLNLKVAQKIKELSADYGINVLLTRNDDSYMSPLGITDFVATKKADAFVSVHNNSANTADSSGFEIYVSRKDQQYIDKSKTLASAVLQNVSAPFAAKQSILMRQVGIWVLDHNSMPAIMIECGYMSNPQDFALLQENKNIEQLAKSILQGVATYANQSASAINVIERDTTPGSENEIDLKSNKVYFPGDDVTAEASQFKLKIDAQHQPIFIVDGVEKPYSDFKKLSPADIESVSVWKDSSAINKFGEKGKNGVVDITTKAKSVSIKAGVNNPLYVLDGKIINKDEMGKLSPNTIMSVNVLKEKSATDKYGDKGKNGVVEITSKNKIDVLPSKDAVDTTPKAASNTEKYNMVFTDAQQPATFHGGQKAWEDFLIKNLNAAIPADKNAPPGTYKVTLSFLIDKNGKVSEVKALNDPGYGTAAEAVRVMKLSPDWDVAMQNKKVVVYRQKQTITFVVQEDAPKKDNAVDNDAKRNFLRFNDVQIHPAFGVINVSKRC